MGNIVVLGSLITDLVARAPRMPLPGESLFGDSFGTFLGGKGLNQAMAAARLGANVTLIGRVGADSFGDSFFPALTQAGIDSTYVERDTHIGTPVSVIIVDASSGQNAIIATPGANMAIPAHAVVSALQAIRERHPIFLCQCETSYESFAGGLEYAHAAGMRTILNVAPIPREPLDDHLFALVDILVVNEVEASHLSGCQVSSTDTAKQAAESLIQRGSRQVIITLGGQGCVWCTRERDTMQHATLPAFRVKAVDATAAGDAFCGALAASLSAGMTMLQALRRATAAGAITVTRMGAVASLPSISEIDTLLSSQATTEANGARSREHKGRPGSLEES
jgi:ribokinase